MFDGVSALTDAAKDGSKGPQLESEYTRLVRAEQPKISYCGILSRVTCLNFTYSQSHKQNCDKMLTSDVKNNFEIKKKH